MSYKKKLFFYVLLSLTLILEIILIILFLKGDINSKSFLLIGVSNLLTMILSIFNIRSTYFKVLLIYSLFRTKWLRKPKPSDKVVIYIHPYDGLF